MPILPLFAKPAQTLISPCHHGRFQKSARWQFDHDPLKGADWEIYASWAQGNSGGRGFGLLKAGDGSRVTVNIPQCRTDSPGADSMA